MHEEVIISGFGGQGVMFAGQLLAYAGLREGRQVAWVPSYGPEMRGGTAHAAIIISDEEIGSLIVARPSIAVVLNLPSLERYAPALKPGGILVMNSSLISERADRDDLTQLSVPASDIALSLGNDRLANMVIIGVLLAKNQIVSLDSVTASLQKMLPETRQRLRDLNEAALRRGVEYARTL